MDLLFNGYTSSHIDFKRWLDLYSLIRRCPPSVAARFAIPFRLLNLRKSTTESALSCKVSSLSWNKTKASRKLGLIYRIGYACNRLLILYAVIVKFLEYWCFKPFWKCCLCINAATYCYEWALCFSFWLRSHRKNANDLGQGEGAKVSFNSSICATMNLNFFTLLLSNN